MLIIINMGTKEKAKNLVNKYWIYLRANLMYDEEAKEDAKQCALIGVDEMIEYLRWTQDYYLANYWREVKQEIELL